MPNNPIQIADAALYLMQTKPSLGIKDPYELTKDQLTAATQLLISQKPLLKRYWNYAADEITSFKNGDVWMGAGWPYQTLQLQADKQPVKEIVPLPTTGWADTWMLAAKAPHPNCALQVDAVRDDAQGRGAAGDRLRRDAGQPARVPVHGQDPEGLVRGLPPERAGVLLQQDQVLEDAGPAVRLDQQGKTCMDYNAWVQAWAQVTG